MTAAYHFAGFDQSDLTWLAVSGDSPDDTGPSLQSDLALLDRIREGDARAFETLLTTYARPLASYAKRFLGATEAAQDAVQDVFAHLWENRARVTVRASVRAYLYTAVRNHSLNVRKHDTAERARINESAEYDTPSSVYQADASVYNNELAARVMSALNSLPPRAREVALLRWRDGLSRSEIAGIMGITVPTVNNQLTTAARTMRTLLADLRDSRSRKSL